MAVQAPEVEPSETPPVEQVPADEEQAVGEVPGITTDLENPAVSPADGSDVDPEPPTGADDESEYSASDESLMQALPQGFAGRSAGPGLLSNGGDDGLMHIADFVSIGINTELVAPGDVLARLYSDVPDLLRNPIVGQESVSVRLEYTGPRGTCVYGATHHTGPQGVVLRWGNLGDQRVPAAEVFSPQPGGAIVTESRAGLMGWWKNSQIPGANLSENVYTATFHPPTDVSIPAMRVELDLWEYPVNQHGQCISRMLPTTVEHVTVDAELEADFVATASTTDPLEYGFESRSTDPQQATADLSHAWDFGDGKTSTAINPTHRFEAPGVYSVTLEVTNDRGQTDSLTRSVTVGAGFIVNSTGDGSAEDPAQGCDTGDTVGENDAPECTLRAAIEAANAAGGGAITFDIAGTPVIAPGSALPRIETPVTIDGTTQPGGWVEVIGGGLAGLRLAGPGSEVTGLALHGAEYGIGVGEGEHRLTGVRLGLDRSGASTGDTEVGLGLQGGRVSLDASEVAAEVGVSASGPVEITGSRIGVDGAGAAIPGVDAGIFIAGPESVVTGSTIHGETVGVLLYGAGASDAEVRDNVIGVEGSGISVSVQGAPGARITGNTVVADGHAGVLISGSNQTTEIGDELELNSPLDEPAAGAVTGGDTLVEGNTISGDTLRAGVWAWAGADRVTVTDTVIAGTQYGVILDGGAGHTVRGSTIGSMDAPVGLGIDAQNVSALRIGDTTAGGNVIVADGDVGIRLGLTGTNNQVSGNTITAAGTIALTATGSGTLTVAGNVVRAQAGFTIDDGFASLTVVGNTLTSDSPESGQLSGILAAAGVLEVRGNEVTGFGTGIAAEAPAATVTENIVLDAAIGGIVVAGDGSEVTGNRVAGSADGIVVAGQGVTVTGNRVGLEATGDTVVGNSSTGILVRQGSAEVRGNAVAGSGEHGIDVASGATATLTANRIWLSGGQAIRTATGPDAPTLRAAIAVYGQPNATRTTLLIEDIPEGAGGRIEVFSDDSCTAPGGEAKHVLSATRTIEAGQTTRIVHLATGHDHLTVTYTDPTGNTSALSDCATRTDYADADNDGSVDPLDAILGWEADPTSGLLATPNEQLLLVRAAPEFDSGGDLGTIGGGVLRQLRIGEQPAGLPAGASMPYGAVFFEVHGIEPGGRAVVVLASLNENVLQGTSYWKYGPATPGAAPSWYDFVFDQASFTGARMTTSDFGGALRNSYTLILADGGRGDADNTANGIVVDPGGPVLFAGSTPGGNDPNGDTPARIGSLPATGSDSAGLQFGLSIALVLAALGSALLMLRDRRWKQPRLRR